MGGYKDESGLKKEALLGADTELTRADKHRSMRLKGYVSETKDLSVLSAEDRDEVKAEAITRLEEFQAESQGSIDEAQEAIDEIAAP